MKRIKEKSLKFMEIRDPAQSVGLWSYWGEYETTLTPMPPTKEAFGKFINGDIARHKTHAEAIAALNEKDKDLKKGVTKSAARKMQEYAAQYHGDFDSPPWFRAWRHYAGWLIDTKEATPYADMRLSFGSVCTGRDCFGLKSRTARVLFLRKNGRYFVGVMLKEGWPSWIVIEKPAYRPEPYERLVYSPAKGMSWETVDAELITELLLDKNLCLFEMAKDEVLEAVLGEANADQRLAQFYRQIEFYVHDLGGKQERFYMRWSVLYNPSKGKYVACDRSRTRVAQAMTERDRDWAGRTIELTDASKADEAARWVVENNGCIVLPADASDDLRMAASRALFYVTLPGRKVDEPGGLLCGYQLPGRMVKVATAPIRYNGGKVLVERVKKRAQAAIETNRRVVVDTLLGRAARVVAERNGLDEAEARKRIEGVGGRKIIETAAWRWGFMEGNAIKLFTAMPQAGSLKLPDLSLALGFEHRLGLEGNAAKVGKMIQTARIRPLEDAVSAVRCSRNVVVAASRIGKPRRGTTGKRVEFQPDSVRIVRDDWWFYLMAVDRHTQLDRKRDLLFEGNEMTVSVEAFRFETDNGARSRQDVSIVREEIDHGKMMAVAMDGRVHLYALDVRAVKGWFEATYTAANTRPCRIVPTIPQFVVGKDGKAEVRITFTVNPQLRRDGQKHIGRSWTSYTDAYPDEAGRNRVYWPSEENATLQEAMRKVVVTDGVLLTDDEHLGEALEGMAYVVVHDDPHAPGGAYRGYALQDRVFFAREREEGKVDKWRKAKIGKPLVEVIAKGSLKAAEKEFEAAIVSDKLADKKTAKFFTLEAPIEIGETYKAMVAREFRRIVFTGTMGWRKQLIRPAHEVALGIWLARLRER